MTPASLRVSGMLDETLMTPFLLDDLDPAEHERLADRAASDQEFFTPAPDTLWTPRIQPTQLPSHQGNSCHNVFDCARSQRTSTAHFARASVTL